MKSWVSREKPLVVHLRVMGLFRCNQASGIFKSVCLLLAWQSRRLTSSRKRYRGLSLWSCAVSEQLNILSDMKGAHCCCSQVSDKDRDFAIAAAKQLEYQQLEDDKLSQKSSSSKLSRSPLKIVKRPKSMQCKVTLLDGSDYGCDVDVSVCLKAGSGPAECAS